MKKSLLVALLLLPCLVHASDDDQLTYYNSYQKDEDSPHIAITENTLLQLAQQTPDSMKCEDLQEKAQQLVRKHPDLFSQLTQMPPNLKRGALGAQDSKNAKTIKNLEEVFENLGKSRWVLRSKEYPDIVFNIDCLRSRGAYLAYSSNQGSVLDKDFDPNKLDYQKMAHTVSLQNMSQIATFLLFLQSKRTNNFKHLNVAPTWPIHIPGRPEELSDENYIVAQKFIPNLKRFGDMERSAACDELKSIPKKALHETHATIVETGIWNHLNANLHRAPDAPDGTKQYYILNMQGPFNHHVNYFCFQGKKGKKKHAEDVAKSLDRMVYGRSKDQAPSEHPALHDVHRTEDWKNWSRKKEVEAILEKSKKYKPAFLDNEEEQ